MPGIAHGFHEGSRSEYLAQYAFSGFGTASAIPHQEDHGFDLYCTLNERRGAMTWPEMPFTLQVKSANEKLVLKNSDSVEWFIRHPLPLFLCFVYREQLRFQVFQTTPKYYFWTIQSLPNVLEFCPERLLPGDRRNCLVGRQQNPTATRKIIPNPGSTKTDNP
jgi:hypothetical protein